MAGGKLKSRHLISASTVFEVVISMVIIIVVFGIAMMIFSNVSRLSLSATRIRAQAVLQETLDKAEELAENGDHTMAVDGLIVRQEVNPFENEPLLSVITLTAFDQGNKQVAQLKKVIVNHEEPR